ncbi:MAG TPA: hypothetical protein VJQ47_04470 [Steroidobacteraceae bacterium]|nr:hypothetical protein [Steroidobacteraceae bacterium]
MRALEATRSTPLFRTVKRLPASPSIAVAVALILSPLAHADDTDVQALKQQVEKLQRRIDQLDAAQRERAAHPDVAAHTQSAAQAAPAGNAPSFFAGPVQVTLGGFVELMAISRSHNEAADWASNYNTGIPFPSSHNYDLSEFHLTERQSRLQALAQGPHDANYLTEAYVETDFGGSTTNGNNNQSGSFSPRVRHFYADYRNLHYGWQLLFGQTWSLVTASKSGIMPRQENIPLTIDGQYVPGFDWLRVSQIRLVKSFGNTFAVAVSAENPAAQVSASTTAPAAANLNNGAYYNTPGAGNAFAPTTNISTDSVPDVVAKAALDPGWGHYEVFGLARWFRSRDIGSAIPDNRTTHGFGVGGSVLLPLVPKTLDFQASFLTGQGIGRYGSAGLPDATVDPNDRSLAPLHGYHALGGLVLKPAAVPELTMFAYAGVEHVSKRSYDVTVTTPTAATYGYGYGSELFSNAGCEIEGAAACAANTSSIESGTLGGWWKFYQGELGNMQIGATDTYIRRTIYAGVGGSPSTSINIVLLSFRYYPYQK